MLVAYMYNSNVLCSYVIDIVSFYSQSMTLYYYAGTYLQCMVYNVHIMYMHSCGIKTMSVHCLKCDQKKLSLARF